MKKAVTSIIVVVLIFIAYNYFSPKWSLFFYPDGCLSCQEKWIIQLDIYDSKEQCRDAGYAMNRARGSNVLDTFECGLNCEVYDDSGYLCKETIDF